ncbi:6941_t:CDS:2, partial [Acaulospora morrowiae]
MADRLEGHISSDSRSEDLDDAITVEPQARPSIEEYDNEMTLTSDFFRGLGRHAQHPDNELTLTGDSPLFRNFNQQTCPNNNNSILTGDASIFQSFSKQTPSYSDLSKVFDQDTKQYAQNDDNLEKPSVILVTSEPQSSIETQNIWCQLFKPFLLEIKSKATWPMARKVLKAAFAYWLAFVFDLIVPAMQGIGSGSFLAIVMVCYYQPSRTFGSLFESAGWGIVGALVATIWSLLGISISNFIRGDEIYYIPATIVNLTFFAIGTFILS